MSGSTCLALTQADGSTVYECLCPTSFLEGYIQLPVGLNIFSNFTMIGWVKFKSYDSVDFGNDAILQDILLCMFSTNYQSGMMDIYSTSAIYSQTLTAPLIQLNQWYHVAFVISGATSYLYLNGGQLISGIFGVPNITITQSNSLNLNSNSDDPTANAIYKDLRIEQIVMSATDVMNDYIIECSNVILQKINKSK